MSGDKTTTTEQYGVLLYYKYAEIPNLTDVVTFYRSNCSSLGLLGRVRLSPHGVNVTVGGNLPSLEKHIEALKTNHDLYEGTDFKLATCHHPSNDKVAEESGFTSLSIRIVKELVTLSSRPLLKSPEISNAGRHLSATEFHSSLHNANSESPEKSLVLLDARNLYETRIGKFQAPNVETLDPQVRQYSDMSSWIDANGEQLKGKNILIFVVHQNESALYVCELCQRQGKTVRSKQLIENGEPEPSLPDLEMHNFSSDTIVLPQVPREDDVRTSRKLRILCLHGFRQNASSFKGRTASLAKKLKKMTEFVFIDAPHELSFIYQTPMSVPDMNCASPSLPPSPPPSQSCNKKFAWFVAPNFDGSSGVDWKVADGPFDPLQYQQQTAGYDISLSHLKKVFSQEGPFDGILGFSQGAAMAALVSAQQEKLRGEMDFKFVVLCSGFALQVKEMEYGPIKCPSLHIFGNEHGNDRQIANQASKELASLYDGSCSVIVEHDCGHIIPTRPPYIDEIKDFLGRFL